MLLCWLSSLTLLLPARPGQHHEPTCDFAALMEKVRGVAEQGMPISDLQADPVFQACESAMPTFLKFYLALH
jgi:hypothetical protein